MAKKTAAADAAPAPAVDVIPEVASNTDAAPAPILVVTTIPPLDPNAPAAPAPAAAEDEADEAAPKRTKQVETPFFPGMKITTR